MIDMRDGNVQHDGFEYNWSFGGKKWRSRAGRFNTGALVRRRRWARLMVRPAAGIDTSADEQPEDSRRKEGSPSSGEALAWDAVLCESHSHRRQEYYSTLTTAALRA